MLYHLQICHQKEILAVRIAQSDNNVMPYFIDFRPMPAVAIRQYSKHKYHWAQETDRGLGRG